MEATNWDYSFLKLSVQSKRECTHRRGIFVDKKGLNIHR